MSRTNAIPLPAIDPLGPALPGALPRGDADFMPELHRSRMAGWMTTRFNEEMSVKTASTSDRRQKRQRRGRNPSLDSFMNAVESPQERDCSGHSSRLMDDLP